MVFKEKNDVRQQEVIEPVIRKERRECVGTGNICLRLSRSRETLVWTGLVSCFVPADLYKKGGSLNVGKYLSNRGKLLFLFACHSTKFVQTSKYRPLLRFPKQALKAHIFR